MSHCLGCDRLLTNREAARKSKTTKEEIGLCDHCLGSVEEVVHVVTVNPYEDFLDDLEEELDIPPLQFGDEEEN